MSSKWIRRRKKASLPWDFRALTVVAYTYSYDYREMPKGFFPVLQVQLSVAGGAGAIDVDAYLDTGAQYSLFDGAYLQGLGLNLLAGVARTLQTLTKNPVDSYVHTVRIEHDDLGSFDLPIGFSDVPIARNVLGRDFFDRVQVGFREHHRTFYMISAP